ncbi:MAG: SUF system NifU family Fe-S cluster assembly protein [Alphaproteobacteria bacterium]|nr:SUF system NifU family Fe-S cluster assembly protein [Alphaproteobacteria bacterium]
MDVRELYQELILDHGKRPRNFRVLNAATHTAHGHNPLCGDKLVLHLVLDDGGKITDAAFQGAGCAISVASASMMTELLKNKTRDEAQKLFTYFHALATGETTPAFPLNDTDTARLQALSGVRNFPVRVKCATLAWHTLKAALEGATTTSTEGA